MLREITFEEAFPLWCMLWPGRDDIKPMSSMIDNDLNIDMTIYEKYSPTFFGAFTDDTNELVGVNSCHPTSDTRMRSRGLYVKFGYGGKGIGQMLLHTTINFAKEKDFEILWTCPRKGAEKTYMSVGFELIGDPVTNESYLSSGVMQQSTNYYAELKLK